MEPKAGYVYLIQAESLDRFKIGCASDVEKRLSTLKTASPLSLRLVATKQAEDMYSEEKKWHELFAPSRVKGEWFDLEPKQFLKIARAFRAEFRIRAKDRQVEDLKIGSIYYISIDGFTTKKVELVELEFFNTPKRLDYAKVIEIDGWQSWNLIPDEVRSTPIGALMNYVTF
jgi:hypothetical protein